MAGFIIIPFKLIFVVYSKCSVSFQQVVFVDGNGLFHYRGTYSLIFLLILKDN